MNEMTNSPAAPAAYEAYRKHTGGKSLITGDPLPAFHELKPEIQEAWCAAAHAAVKSQDFHRDADYAWHAWLNNWNMPSAGGVTFDHSMYKFRSMLQFLHGGWKQIRDAFNDSLPTIHRQCSHSAPEVINKNCLKCAFGKDVTQCEILTSIKTSYTEQKASRESLVDTDMFKIMANTCAWHMYTEPLKTGQFLDTSEGWLTDESDRMYWKRVYESLAAGDMGEDSE